ncbi:hypothetical protein LUCX_297 [Xanthomonas phage vB_XciM_LucasX]|nr:hypothetical protein LUCX_297 [Xanthomonas phage vB_XciM_LucasX]
MSLLLKSLSGLASLSVEELLSTQRFTVITPEGLFNVTMGNLTEAATAAINARVDALSDAISNGTGPSIWPTPRTLSLTGLVTGSVSFDGSGNMSLATSIADGAIAQAKVNGLVAKLNEIGTATNNRWGTGYTTGPSPTTYSGDLNLLSGATFIQTNSSTSSVPESGGDFTILSNGPTNTSHQLALRSGEMWLRSQAAGAWTSTWHKFWTSDNLDPSVLLLKTDTASSATKLATARNISATGVITAGAQMFDGTQNVVLNTAIADGALSIAKVSGLQSALNTKYELRGQIAVSTNLNTLTTSGLYLQATASEASTGNNYPVANLPGILRITTQGTLTVQEYITNTNVQYRRFYTGSSWSTWNKAWTAADFDPAAKANLSGANFTGGITAPGVTVNGDLTANAMYAGSYQSRGDANRWVIQSLAGSPGFAPRGGLWQDDTGISLVSNFGGVWVPLSITNDAQLYFNDNAVYHAGNYNPAMPVPSGGVLNIGDTAGTHLRFRNDGKYTINGGTTWRDLNESPQAVTDPLFNSVSIGADTDIRLYEDNTAGTLLLRTGNSTAYSYFNFGGNGNLTVPGRIYAQGSGEVWHSGNFNPDNKLGVNATAAAATKLATARTINGVAFDGTQNITITAAATVPDSPTFTGSTWFDVNNGSTAMGVIREYGTTGVAFDAVNAANNAYAPLNFTATALTFNTQTIWHAGNFNPASKANLDSPSFTGPVISTYGSLRAQGWAGTATNGVLYLSSTDSYIFKNGSFFSFKNAEGAFEATLNAGGTIWTANNFSPASKLNYRAPLDVNCATPSGNDWNNATTNGWWMASGAANAPGGGTGWFLGTVTVHNGSWVQQEVRDFTAGVNGTKWRRWRLADTWSAWTQDEFFGGAVSANRFFAGWDSGNNNSISCSNWFRSSGNTGLYFNDYGGGVYMQDSTYVRTYNNKAMAASWFQSTGGFAPGGSAENAAFRATGSFGGGYGLIDGSYQITMYSNTGNLMFAFGQNGVSTKAQLNADGTMYANDYALNSDATLKTEVSDLVFTGRLRPVSFQWIESGKFDFGFIAQEVQALYPDAVELDELSGKLRLKQQKLVAVVAAQANQNSDDIDALKGRLALVEAQLAEMKELVAALRSQ